MMKTLLRLSLAVSAGLTASAGFAQVVTDPIPESLERSIVFEGEATRACLIEAPTVDSQVNTRLDRAGGGVNVALSPTGFIDPETGVPRQSGISLSLPITCNTAHQLRIASREGALIREGAGTDTGAFRSRLDFDVEVNWAGITRTFSTQNSAQLIIPVPDAATGQASINISIPGGGAPLAAGQYGDTLIVEVEATS
ncbi:hypothetical protein [Allosphingosinicella indica]|uniref:Spore coat protein U domain-containing protein n=1 Tax=Allosphingosinicella indica TaxID=941907 RepID=A0A1X7G6K9_9SPHN|nr:hypothetical protein [Allosphingosinicella indica]SMF64974.1 hypothetical protein SAMN06295910_1267 [Allosphingosinicella indica]